MIRDFAERQAVIDGLTAQYIDGHISETVYAVSLGHQVDQAEVRYLIELYQEKHRNSRPFRRGDVR